MVKYNRSRGIRVHDVEANKSKSTNADDLMDDFNIIFKILIIAGYVFPPLNVKKPKCKWYAKLFEVVINLLACFVIIINIFFWQRRYSTVALHFSTTLTISLAISVRFVVFLCRKDIPSMTRNLIQLYEDVTWRKPHQSLRRYIILGCFTTLVLTTLASTLEGYRIQAAQAKGEHSIEFLIKANNLERRYQKYVYYMFMCLLPLKMYFAYGVSVILLIFCCTVYTVTKRIVLALNNRIRAHDQDLYKSILTHRTINEYLSFYNRLSRIVAEIDDVLSPCVLLLYGLMVSAQFYTLTVLISKDTEPTSLTTALHNIIVFLLTTVAFLVMTLTASKVTEVAEDVKRSLHKLAENITSSEEMALYGSNITNTYFVLIAILNGSQLSFTGWKMFNINRSFILTTMGVMISYGVIIVQIGRKYGSA